jgi:hypothetical protein
MHCEKNVAKNIIKLLLGEKDTPSVKRYVGEGIETTFVA